MDDMNEGLLRITNHQDHPTNHAYKVFFFHNKNAANEFEKLLKQNNIPFEHDVEEARGKQMFLFGVLKTNLDQVSKLNYLALGKHRKPLVSHPILKWVILIFGLLVILFAFIGYLKS